MTRESILVLTVILAVFVVSGLLMLREKRRQRRWFLRKVRNMWGSVAEREYTAEELESISHYAEKHRDGQFMIDDITWNDLGMDQIFVNMNTTVSSCGEDVLYRMLRIPEFDREVLEERERLIEYFRSHQQEREQIQILVSEVRKMSDLSLSDYIHVLKDVEQKGKGKYILLACLTLASIGFIFLEPVTGVLLLMLVLSFNGVIHMQDAKKIEPYLNCLICILRLLKAAEGFDKVKNPQIQGYLDRIGAAEKQMRKFRRGSILVTSMNSVQDGIEAVILSYLKIAFQVDLIKFYSMVKNVSGHEQDIEALFYNMGELDALIALASFREYLPYWCRPEFREPEERGQKGQVFVEMEDLYHPLIPDPVANSVKIHSGVLVTGSNASGKSTFLKTVAVNAILAQTALTCVSHSYRGDYLKVMTSMALRDNLEGGESYYIVEIKSLQRILEECKKEQPVLCIVDEVLRGTNTIERIAASSRILKSLAMPHVLPLAATHDIELSYILEPWYRNYHFEEEVKDHDICFNYLLKEGRATTRNAIKLLEIIGYDPEIIREAQDAARVFEETGVWK
ncbi:MAG: DNA mismatch repair protein MutS [Clostridiales bacterium]|nr:DNA mismatch repair protein MutS [Clostridiales bacterium]